MSPDSMLTSKLRKVVENRTVVILYLISALVLIASYPIFRNITKNTLAAHLTVNKPVSNPDILIVEGWLFATFIPDVKQEFDKGRYEGILIAWQPQLPESDGQAPVKYESDRVGVYRRLVALGVDSSKIRIASTPAAAVHNTLIMALAVKEWLRANEPLVTRVNVCSANIHGRKSWVAYKRVLEKSFAVGIISFSRRNIPVSQWWKKSPGGGTRWFLRRWVGVFDAALWPLSWLDRD